MKYSIGFPTILSKFMIFALLGWVLCQPDPAIAKIYKYKDDQGKTHFTDDAGKIPLKYRDQGRVKKFRGVSEPTPAPEASGSPGQASGGGGESGENGDEGLSSEDEGLVKKAIQVFKVGITLGDQYKNTMPTFSNGQGAVNAIQSALPLKETMVIQLEGTRVPALQSALAFLKKSIAIDKQTTSVGQGLKRRIAAIFTRLADESKEQSALVQQLEQALVESAKKKAEAAMKNKEEASQESMK